jgi:tetratricopeptide (TPR) repeat protein
MAALTLHPLTLGLVETNHQRAIHCFTLALAPTDLDANLRAKILFHRGARYRLIGELTQARADLNRAWEYKPQNKELCADIQYQLSKICIDLCLYPEAFDHLQIVKKWIPPEVESQTRVMERADISVSLGHPVEALIDCEKALKYEDSDPNTKARIYLVRADAYNKMRKIPEALEACTQAEQCKPSNHEDLLAIILFRKGSSHQKLGEFTKAEQCYTSALALKPSYERDLVASILYFRSTLFRDQGKPFAARSDLSRALENNPTHVHDLRAEILFGRAMMQSTAEERSDDLSAALACNPSDDLRLRIQARMRESAQSLKS